jgi:hypothetical protein
MNRRCAPRCPNVLADRIGARNRLDPITAAETDDKRMGESGVFEIERKGVVDHTARPGGGGCPTFGAAGLVEPGMHNFELAAQPVRWHRNSHAHRIAPLRFALGPRRCSGHPSPLHSCYVRLFIAWWPRLSSRSDDFAEGTAQRRSAVADSAPRGLYQPAVADKAVVDAIMDSELARYVRFFEAGGEILAVIN